MVTKTLLMVIYTVIGLCQAADTPFRLRVAAFRSTTAAVFTFLFTFFFLEVLPASCLDTPFSVKLETGCVQVGARFTRVFWQTTAKTGFTCFQRFCLHLVYVADGGDAAACLRSALLGCFHAKSLLRRFLECKPAILSGKHSLNVFS